MRPRNDGNRLNGKRYRSTKSRPVSSASSAGSSAVGLFAANAALPHVDRFVEGHSLAALDDLVEVIAS